MKISEKQLEEVNDRIRALVAADSFYGKKLEAAGITEVHSAEEFEALPFSEKKDLRDAYPLGLMTAPEKDIVRIHSSSGTTGLPVIIPYTAKDVDDWAIQFKRCYEMAGVTKFDRVQITPGYGLWTAGIGFQNGAEKLGAMVIPMGPGNTEKQIQMMVDMKSTVLCSTSSYALLLAEEIEKRGIRDKIHLKTGVIGSERWSEAMRRSIREKLGIELYDIYGLTEAYGPGIGISCKYECGMHYWDDYVYIEIIDPHTLAAHTLPHARHIAHTAGRLRMRLEIPASRHDKGTHGRHGEDKGRQRVPKPDRGNTRVDPRGEQRVPDTHLASRRQGHDAPLCRDDGPYGLRGARKESRAQSKIEDWLHAARQGRRSRPPAAQREEDKARIR